MGAIFGGAGADIFLTLGPSTTPGLVQAGPWGDNVDVIFAYSAAEGYRVEAASNVVVTDPSTGRVDTQVFDGFAGSQLVFALELYDADAEGILFV